MKLLMWWFELNDGGVSMVMGGVGGRVSCEVCECWGFIMGKF